MCNFLWLVFDGYKGAVFSYLKVIVKNKFYQKLKNKVSSATCF